MIQVTKQLLNEKNFVKEQTVKTAIILHHTAGSYRPDFVINGWNSDALGRVATHYVIGGAGSIGGQKDRTYDGDIFQAIDEKYCGFHLGIKGNFNRFDKCSIGIEICNWGYLRKGIDGKFYTYVNTVVDESEVVDLGYVWRGFRYFHKYTDSQISALKSLITDITIRHQIKANKELSFEYSPELISKAVINGLFTHVNFRRDKYDCSPQPNLINMLRSL